MRHRLLLSPRLAESDRKLAQQAWDQWVSEPHSPSRSTASPAEEWIGLMTSGSQTGFGRIVVQSQARIEAAAHGLVRALGARSGEVWLGVLPEEHVAGLAVKVRAQVSGGIYLRLPLLDRDGWSSAGFAREVRSLPSVEWLSLVPAQLRDLVNDGIKAPVNLRATLVGAGRLGADLARAASELGWRPRATYASTEAGATVALAAEGEGGSQLRYRPLAHLATTQSSHGTLLLSGPSLALGRIDVRASRWEALSQPFDTGDLVHLNGDGSFRFLGRRDLRIKILGENVDVAGLRERLHRLFAEQNARGESDAALVELVPLADARAGARFCLAVVGEIGTDNLVSSFNQGVRPFEQIKQVIVVSNLTRSELGKPLWLRALCEMGFEPISNGDG